MPKSLKPNGRGASPPAKPKPAKKAAKKKTSKKKAAAKTDISTSSYIRNIHNGAGGVRLDLTDDTRLFLAPRGQLGDIMQVTEETRQDPMYQRNVNLLFEEITLEEGEEVLRKQNTNAQAYRGPTPMDFITNELGKKYAQKKATITPSAESQGVVVGQVSTGGEGVGSREIGNIAREVQSTNYFSAQPPQEVQVPGSRRVFDPNIMPAGLTAAQAGIFLETPPEKRLELIEYFEANDNTDYRNSLNVSVESIESTE